MQQIRGFFWSFKIIIMKIHNFKEPSGWAMGTSEERYKVMDR